MSRELDALVAEKVMGYKVIETDDCNGIDNFWLSMDGQHPLEWESGCGERDLPEYSTRIEDAWEVMEKMAALRPGAVIETIRRSDGVFRVEIRDGLEEFVERGSTAPLAICLAALKHLAWKIGKELEPIVRRVISEEVARALPRPSERRGE